MKLLGALLAVTMAVFGMVAGQDVDASYPFNLGAFDPNVEPDEQGYCGDIVRANLKGYSWFFAEDVIQCLTSIPFNAAVAARFVTYYNQTLQFQSTSAYIRNPPPGYQQAGYDVFGELAQIQSNIAQGHYRNQYAFEADIQRIPLLMHDSHVNVYAGALNQFTFASPYELVTVYRDDIKAFKIYVREDLNGTDPTQLAAIEKIDGLPIFQFLEEFATNQSFGMVEANADWNQLMWSPAQSILGTANPFSGGATFYPGSYMSLQYDDGHNETWYWQALYNSPGFTGPLDTGGDFYNFFVLGLPPANFNDEYNKYLKAHPSNFSLDYFYCSKAKSWPEISNFYTAYPNDTLNHQDCLGVDSSGFITGYFFADIKTAIISIPSFDAYGPDQTTFSKAVAEFIAKANAIGAERIIIDLQQNSGGQQSLAFDVFRQFFPEPDIYAGSRMRSHDLANDLGTTLTSRFENTPQSDDTTNDDEYPSYNDLVYSEWVVTDRKNPNTGHNFTSWQEFYGPEIENGDAFSLTQQYNLRDRLFDDDALDFHFADCYYTKAGCPRPPWTGEQFVLLTDGVCASSCSLFVELMTQTQGLNGVRTVAVGGLPLDGPMQAASGSRGARAYSSDQLDGDTYDAQFVDPSTASNYTFDTGMMNISQIGVNLRHLVRRNETMPTQFLYTPADCRINWTAQNWNNYTRLWHDVYQAVFQDSSICVPGSVNAAALNPKRSTGVTKRSDIQGPLPESEYIKQGLGGGTSKQPHNETSLGYLDFGGTKPAPLIFCTPLIPGLCGGSECAPFSITCRKDLCIGGKRCLDAVKKHICKPSCRLNNPLDNVGGNCGTRTECRIVKQLNSNRNSNAVFSRKGGRTIEGAKGGERPGANVGEGICEPLVPATIPSCEDIKTDRQIQAFIAGFF